MCRVLEQVKKGGWGGGGGERSGGHYASESFEEMACAPLVLLSM